MNNKEFSFGLRSPTSKGIGSWDGAFVGGMSPNGKIFGAFFVDDTDFISDSTLTIDKLKEAYDGLLQKGWHPMTKEYIKKTAGLNY